VKEMWRAINVNYDASNLGRIRSCRRYPKVHVLKPHKNKQTGYLMVMLGRGNSRYVHELVLLAFKGSRPGFCTASHLNGKRDDNRVENLAWESQRDNCARQLQHGTRNCGERQGHSRLTESQVRILKAVKDPDYGWYTFMADLYGVHANTIRDVHQGRTWRHIK
jgi:hypothetical protein